ncbi:hypothetical protein FisN_13Hu381 [Fistulifera solaris]|uniref:Uncharacterized protein n=1 Tax=Fistulifera solaris TaxID=1519565 RepID=A0A1Z5KMN0_FISSO|nr:hypothetical protein FisN_13Hu381 [Fistulifera solaris]|eukprot:GAX27536.1 hypothetical protein FisN_13Hu381 [Fistulifera solaris]
MTSHYFPQQLRHAIEIGSIPEMEVIQVKNWNQADGSGSTPLSMACRFGHLHVVEFLVNQHRVVLNVFDVCKKTPLHVASDQGHAGIVAFLLQAGASQDMCNSQGETPLVAACSKGHLSVVKLLLQQASDEQVQKALSAACFSWKSGCIHVVQHILDQRHSQPLLNTADGHGRTPLLQVLRAWKYSKDNKVREEKTELMKYLVTMGATVNADTFLYATSSENQSAVYWMVRHHPELWQPLRSLLGNPTPRGCEDIARRKSSEESSRWTAILKRDSFDMSPSYHRRRGRRGTMNNPIVP